MKKKMHMIGNAHLDPVWLWNWQEGFQENKATFKSALDRLEEYDDFVFTSSSAQLYWWIEHNDSEMFDRIKQRVKEDRWIICGGWWIQPDCNIPSGESFARHALIGQNYFKEKFGKTASVGYNVDSFGHNGMLPQILKKSGIDSYIFLRPDENEKELPSRLFLWESIDGSQVVSYRIPFSYGTFSSLAEHIDLCSEEFADGINHIMSFYGVGNHGGGPTIENIKIVKDKKGQYKNINVEFSDPNTFFNEIKENIKDLPVVHGDLQHHASGCYSVHSEVKKLNRMSENALLSAEKFSIIAKVIKNQKYPDDFNIAWRDVLFNQFHDILAGTSIEEAYFDTRNEYGEALAIAARNQNNALQAITFNINIEHENGMLPVVVFNPHSWEIETEVEVEAGLFRNYSFPDNFIIVDDKDKIIPHQTISTLAKVRNRTRIVYNAIIPPLGYRVYKIKKGESSYQNLEVDKTNINMENQMLKIVMDEKTGGIKSIFDKQQNIEVLSDPVAVAAVLKDDSDTWSHGVARFDQIEGFFKPISIKKIENGPIRSSIRVISKYNESTLVQIFSINKNKKEIFVKSKVNWQEKFKCLKLKFPVNIVDYKATYEIPFGHIERESDMEESMQKWIDLSGKVQNNSEIYGMSIINDGKYSVDVNKNTINLTVLRSPVYAHHQPVVLEDEMDNYQFIDQGIQEFKYIILPHDGTWRNCKVVQRGLELNQPPVTTFETYHKGNLPVKDSYILIDKENIIMSALKKAYGSDELVIRIYEAYGIQTKARIKLFMIDREFNVKIKPYEIKTYIVPIDKKEPVREVNLAEWDI